MTRSLMSFGKQAQAHAVNDAAPRHAEAPTPVAPIPLEDLYFATPTAA